jgi:hypothetical protein
MIHADHPGHPLCYCGAEPTQRVPIATHLVDGIWREEYEDMCDRCALETWTEREWARSS